MGDIRITVNTIYDLGVDENGIEKQTGNRAYVKIDDELMKIASVKDVMHKGKPAKELTLSRYPHQPGTECKNIIQADE